MRRRHILAVGVLFLILGIVGAATASGGDRVVGDCKHSQVKPAQIIVYCADANGAFEQVHWSSFGGATARGSGSWMVNDCTPNCAAGHVHSYPVTLTLSQARKCPDGHKDYRVATARYSSLTRRPAGAAGRAGQPGTLSLPCPLTG